MNNKRATKRALLTSVMALVMCVVMLVGTTFAWFTDPASTGVNKIQAGNLDVKLEYKNSEQTTFVEANTNTKVFKDGALWEPGHVEYVVLKIRNAGNLALKYKLGINIASETGSTNVFDKPFKLSDYIKFAVIDGESTNLANRDALVTEAAAAGDHVLNAGYTDEDHLVPVDKETAGDASSKTVTLVVWMPTDVGNEANHKTGVDAPSIDLGINVVATQYTYEYDSYGNDYDAGADVELATSATINGQEYASMQEAYEAVQPQVSTVFGLGQEAFSASDTDKCAKFDELFPEGKITWTIYGEQKLTNEYMLSFGRKASYFGARTLKEIEVVGGNSQATLDLTGTDGTFALPYNWWGSTVDNIKVTFKGITFKGIKSIPSTWATPGQETPYTFENCTFNGNLYGYHDYNINLTIKNCTFNAPADTSYALMLQSDKGITGKVTVDGCKFNGYTRGVNLQRPGTDFVFTNNTIVSTVSVPDRGAIQLTDGKSFVVTGNTVDVKAGNAFWFHDAATNSDVTYTINDNDIKAPYIGYYGTSFDVNTKITSSGNKFNSTDITKCMKKGKTVAEATNLTAIH